MHMYVCICIISFMHMCIHNDNKVNKLPDKLPDFCFTILVPAM